jgi:hypothetical protein
MYNIHTHIHTFESFKNTVDLYHGGGLESGLYAPMYLSYDKSQAEAYSRGNNGKLHKFQIDLNKVKIMDEYEIRPILTELGLKSKEEGWDLEELNFYEIIDDRFDTSLSDSDLILFFNELDKRGIKAIEFLDSNIITLQNDIYNVVVLDTSILK